MTRQQMVLPHQVGGFLPEHLNAAFFHGARRHPQHAKSDLRLTAIRQRQRPAQMNRWLRCKPACLQPGMCSVHIVDGKSDQMEPCIARHGSVELSRERRIDAIAGCENFQIAAPQHGAAVAGPGRHRGTAPGIGIVLGDERGQDKP